MGNVYVESYVCEKDMKEQTVNVERDVNCGHDLEIVMSESN